MAGSRFTNPPMHERCALYSTGVCPLLSAARAANLFRRKTFTFEFDHEQGAFIFSSADMNLIVRVPATS